MIFLITDDILKSRTDYMEEFKRLPNSIQQRVSNWTLSSMKRMWEAETETRRGRKSCSGGKAVGSYFFSPVDLKIWCWMLVLWAWKTMTRGLVFQSCGSPLYLPVSILTSRVVVLYISRSVYWQKVHYQRCGSCVGCYPNYTPAGLARRGVANQPTTSKNVSELTKPIKRPVTPILSSFYA